MTQQPDLWRAYLRSFGCSEPIIVAEFHYESAARGFFHELVNRVSGDCKIKAIELYSKGDDEVLEHAKAVVGPITCTGNSWILSVQRVREFPPILAPGDIYDFVHNKFEELF